VKALAPNKISVVCVGVVNVEALELGLVSVILLVPAIVKLLTAVPPDSVHPVALFVNPWFPALLSDAIFCSVNY
jgi:hypothetical protein